MILKFCSLQFLSIFQSYIPFPIFKQIHRSVSRRSIQIRLMRAVVFVSEFQSHNSLNIKYISTNKATTDINIIILTGFCHI